VQQLHLQSEMKFSRSDGNGNSSAVAFNHDGSLIAIAYEHGKSALVNFWQEKLLLEFGAGDVSENVQEVCLHLSLFYRVHW
jgi:hypothetical protein